MRRSLLYLVMSCEIEIVGEVALHATVDKWALDLDQAKLIFYPRCRRH